MTLGSSGFERPPRWAVILIVASAAWLVVGYVLLGHRDQAGATGAADTGLAPGAAAPSPRMLASLADALADPAKPLNIGVVGDSTSDDKGIWPTLFTQWLADTYHRPITYIDWINGPAGQYTKPVTVGPGVAGDAPVTLWNGSVGGQNAQFSLSRLGDLLPNSRFDAVIVNHGHNQGPGEITPVLDLANHVRSNWPDAIVAVTEQNPNHTPDTQQSTRVQSVARAAQAQGYQVLDVYDPFEESGAPDGLLTDTQHPNIQGSQVWAGVVEAAFRPTP